MKKNLILSIFIFLSLGTFGQTQKNFKAGGYSTLGDFLGNAPNYLDTFVISKRTTGSIKAWGGNDFKVESTTEKTTKKNIKNEIWGIVVDDTLYLNGLKLTGLIWYSKVEIFGKYCFLRPAFPVAPKIQKELGLNDPQYGYMFGAVGGAIQGAQMAVKRIPLIYDLSDGHKMLLSKKNILILLETQQELKSSFESEQNQDSEVTLLKYLKLLNGK
ncbi:MAG: DUF6563 family protein [Ferruginibacter sp.]